LVYLAATTLGESPAFGSNYANNTKTLNVKTDRKNEKMRLPFLGPILSKVLELLGLEIDQEFARPQELQESSEESSPKALRPYGRVQPRRTKTRE
jgi:hypothetical protein